MRQPVNIHAYLYHIAPDGTPRYAIFRRADDPKCWQGISGGVESGETPAQAALREAREEAGTPPNLPLYPLDTVSALPSTLFSVRDAWGPDVVVCPMHFFAIPYSGLIALSDEHTEYRWCTYEEAEPLVYWHDQKTALWELHERIRRGNLIR